jgi:5'-nucleotidase
MPVRTIVAQRDDIGAPRAAAPLTILQLNDVYSTGPVNDLGGLARVATLKKTLATEGRRPFLMMAGDFLSSSVESTVFKGEQMVAALNAAGLDMATLGNHEFDFGVDVLLERMRESKWQWVISNVIDSRTGMPIGGAAPYVVRTFGALKVGFIGLCIVGQSVRPDDVGRLRFVDPLEAASTYVPALKGLQVDAIVLLSHLTFAEDRSIAERFPDIDVIVGGHEHYPIAAFENRTFISKAGSDGKFVARIDLNRRAGGVVERFYELIPINKTIPDDPSTAEVVTSFSSRLPNELNREIGSTRVALDGIAQHLRASETNLGNLVADALRERTAANVSIVNAGGIRGDRLHAPGPISRRDLIEWHPFGNIVCVVSVPGKVLLEALNAGVSRLPAAAGQFPQVSGLIMTVEPGRPAGSRIRDVRVNGEPLDLGKSYTVAVPDFVLRGGDGYTMFAGHPVLVTPETGDSLEMTMEKYLAARGPVSPVVEGRITIGP